MTHDGRVSGKGPIDFPVQVTTTKCQTQTGTKIVRTPHGIVRKEVKKG